MHRVHPHTIRCTREHQNAFCALTTGTRMKKKIAKCIHVRKMQSYPGLVNIKWNLLLTFFVHSPFFAADAVAVAASFQFFVFLYAILADIAGMFAEIEALEINGPSEESHVRKKKQQKNDGSQNLSRNRNDRCCVFVSDILSPAAQCARQKAFDMVACGRGGCHIPFAHITVKWTLNELSHLQRKQHISVWKRHTRQRCDLVVSYDKFRNRTAAAVLMEKNACRDKLRRLCEVGVFTHVVNGF